MDIPFFASIIDWPTQVSARSARKRSGAAVSWHSIKRMKHVPSPPDFARMTITNIYLSASEYAVPADLEALELRKRRYSIEHDSRIFGIDVFDAQLSGLVLAEVGFETRVEMDQPLDLPPWGSERCPTIFASPEVRSPASRQIRLPN